MRVWTRSNILGLLSLSLVGVMQVWGAYRKHWWFDNVAHFLGGFGIGAIASDGVEDDEMFAVGLAMSMAGFWEVFEYLKGIRPWSGEKTVDEAAEDTLLDTILVAFGAWLAQKLLE